MLPIGPREVSYPYLDPETPLLDAMLQFDQMSQGWFLFGGGARNQDETENHGMICASRFKRRQAPGPDVPAGEGGYGAADRRTGGK